MPHIRPTTAIVAALATGWLVHDHHQHVAAEQRRDAQHIVDWVAFHGFADWRSDHPGGTCADALPRFTQLTIPRDPWGGGLRYSCAGNRIAARSAGPDGVFDSDDDVASDKP